MERAHVQNGGNSHTGASVMYYRYVAANLLAKAFPVFKFHIRLIQAASYVQ